MRERSLLKLLVSKEEAREKIQERIEEGQILRDLPMESEDEYEAIGKKTANWSKYNKDLLVKLFESST